MKPVDAALPRLLLVTDPDGPRGLVDGTLAALADVRGPEVLVQLRAKTWPARALFEAGRALAHGLAPRGIPLVINGRVDVALALGAGVHLPERAITPGDARSLLGPGVLVGRSCHDRAGLVRAFAEGATYATVGPVGLVPQKNPPLGLDGLRAALEGVTSPVFALGGIGPEQVAAVRAAGAHGVAVLRSVSRAVDPGRALGEILYALARARAS